MNIVLVDGSRWAMLQPPSRFRLPDLTGVSWMEGPCPTLTSPSTVRKFGTLRIFAHILDASRSTPIYGIHLEKIFFTGINIDYYEHIRP